MTKAAEKVVAGFVKLSQSDRNKVVEELNKLINAPQNEKKAIEESYAIRAGIDLGPIQQGSCPCCGK